MAFYNSNDTLSKIHQNFTYQSCVVLFHLLFLLWVLCPQLICALLHCSYLPQQEWTNSINSTFQQLSQISFHCDKSLISKPQPFQSEKAFTRAACEVAGVRFVWSKSSRKLLRNPVLGTFYFTNLWNDGHDGTIDTFSQTVKFSCNSTHLVRMFMA